RLRQFLGDVVTVKGDAHRTEIAAAFKLHRHRGDAGLFKTWHEPVFVGLEGLTAKPASGFGNGGVSGEVRIGLAHRIASCSACSGTVESRSDRKPGAESIN